jgi:hypothetical protein
MSPGELGDHQSGGSGIDGEVLVHSRCRQGDALPSDVPYSLRAERIGSPSAGVVHEDVHGPELLLRSVEKQTDVRGVCEVCLDRGRSTPVRHDEFDDMLGMRGPVFHRGVLHREVGGVLVAKVGQEDARATSSEDPRSGSADAVVGPGDDRDMTVDVERRRVAGGGHRASLARMTALLKRATEEGEIVPPWSCRAEP